MGVMRIKFHPQRRAILGGVLWLAGFGPALAKSKKQVIAPGRASRVTSGQGFILEDERRVRLAGILAPRMAYEDIRAEPLAMQAREALKRLVSNRSLHFSDPAPDKFSRLRAQVFANNGNAGNPVWVQAEMIRLGFARVRSWRDDNTHTNALLALEESARQARRGLWAEQYYAVRNPQSVGVSIGSFQIVQGRIVDVAEVRGRVYLNFGADWRQDFTISIAPKDKKRFERDGIILAGLSGAKVRARGLIRQQNGPILYLDHSQALEILPE